MKQELLPCPWCLGKPLLEDRIGHSAPRFWVFCPYANHGHVAAPSEDLAIERWNTRAPGARVQILTKALREAREDMEGWQAYASEYFRDKHDAGADLAKIDAALAEAGITQEKVG